MYRLLYDRRMESDRENIRVESAISDVKHWLSQYHERWLLVFDSADLMKNEEDPSYYDLGYYLPDSSSVQIVSTTRTESIKDISILDAVKVREMEEIEAVELFFRSSKINDKIPETEVEVGLIVLELGCLALAVILAGSYVSVTRRQKPQNSPLMTFPVARRRQ